MFDDPMVEVDIFVSFEAISVIDAMTVESTLTTLRYSPSELLEFPTMIHQVVFSFFFLLVGVWRYVLTLVSHHNLMYTQRG